MTKFWKWNVRNEAEEPERELIIDGTIAEESWWDDEISPAQFREELEQGDGPVTVWINSPGGDCFAASQIYTMLREYAGRVTVKIDGIAASAASVIAMAGDQVLMAPTALMMIHNPATVAWGDVAEMQKAIEMLDEVKESIINAYEIKTGMQRAKISRLMDAETWMNARKAIELGFADGLIEGKTETGSAEAYAFEARTVEMKAVAKAAAKMNNGKKPEPQAPGRSIEQLLEELKTKK